MTEADALKRLKRLCAPEYAPELDDDDDLKPILEDARTFDSERRLPADAGYEPTYDFNQAAAAAWDAKAARAASGYDFGEDTQYFRRDQIFRHCRDMAKRYSRGMTPTSEV